METLLIAVGNTLRRDDGVGRRVLELLGEVNADTRTVHQPAPELSEEIARYDRVIFIDADAGTGASDLSVMENAGTGFRPTGPSLEPLDPDSRNYASLGHLIAAAEIVGLARSLYGFEGEALLCRVPAHDFSAGEGLSPHAEANAGKAASLLRAKLA